METHSLSISLHTLSENLWLLTCTEKFTQVRIAQYHCRKKKKKKLLLSLLTSLYLTVFLVSVKYENHDLGYKANLVTNKQKKIIKFSVSKLLLIKFHLILLLC